MLSFEQAMETMLSATRFLGTETIPWTACVGRVLAQDVAADRDLPPFDKSAMDGWACKRSDLGRRVPVGQSVAAGQMPCFPQTLGTCARIMTGAPVPVGTELVVKWEDASQDADGLVILPEKSETNICPKGEDLRQGQVVLRPGMVLGPAHLAVLATLGQTQVQVARRPKVAVIATGSELVEPDQIPGPAAIRDSNSVQLCAQIAAIGAEPIRIGIARDEEQALIDVITQARAQADLVVLSGGVSEGDFDLVPGVLEKMGFHLRFHSVAMQPGKPMLFGDDGQKWCVGLPGNPVATFTITELMLRPFLLKLMGHEHHWRPITARLSAPWKRRKAERMTTIPVACTGLGTVAPIEYHGSAHIDALCRADGLISVPVGVTHLPEGSEVHVRLL